MNVDLLRELLRAGVQTHAGMLLVPEGQVLTEVHIESILNHHRLQALSSPLLVYSE